MYEISITRKAQKFYEKASDELAVQIDDCIDNLSRNPYKGADTPFPVKE